MKRLFSRTRPQTNWLSSPGFTPRQVTALAVAVLLAVLLIPMGARAAQVVSAIITDPAGTNKAHVDASGNLQVAGSVKLANTPLSVTTTDDPGRQAFEASAQVDFGAGDFAVGALLAVPEGKRLVIQFASMQASLQPGQRLWLADIHTTVSGDQTGYNLIPTFVATNANGSDVVTASQDLTLYADGGTNVVLEAGRNSSDGGGSLLVAVSGYLIDCSVAPCN